MWGCLCVLCGAFRWESGYLRAWGHGPSILMRVWWSMCSGWCAGLSELVVGGGRLGEWWRWCQVSKDFRAEDELDVEAGVEDQPAAEESWRVAAAGFLKREGGEGQRKRFRGKSLEWLLASQNQLDVMIGGGWERFVVAEHPADRGDPTTWPTLTLAIDQGPDGWSAAQFLRWKRVCFLLLRDPAHRRHNDALLAMRDCGLWNYMALLICVLNADHAPWGEARWLATFSVGSCANTCVFGGWVVEGNVATMGGGQWIGGAIVNKVCFGIVMNTWGR